MLGSLLFKMVKLELFLLILKLLLLDLKLSKEVTIWLRGLLGVAYVDIRFYVMVLILV